MAINSRIIKELESKVGVESPPILYEIENGMIKRFVQAVGDPNPLWQNEEYAITTRYDGIIAPPNFVLTLGFDKMLQGFLADSEITILHGSTELECYKIIRPGDSIIVISTIRNIRERQGEIGKMLFVTFDMLYKNQKEELVANCHQMAILC
jgi:acyl dehydratase